MRRQALEDPCRKQARVECILSRQSEAELDCDRQTLGGVCARNRLWECLKKSLRLAARVSGSKNLPQLWLERHFLLKALL
jgi:hypothetical protein